jgi:energy-coupling factor transporter ATP-binding protein EcfA2
MGAAASLRRSRIPEEVCGKMSEVSKGGRTIVFVSRQMSQIRRLCERVIWVDRDVISQDGPTLGVVFAYEATFAGQPEVDGLGKQDLGRSIQFVK